MIGVFSSLLGPTGTGISFFITFILAAALTAITIRVCRKHGWVSKPRSDRWHVGTPAFFGGVPIYAAVLMGSAVCVPAFNRFAWTLVVLSSLIFLLGLLDDLLR